MFRVPSPRLIRVQLRNLEIGTWNYLLRDEFRDRLRFLVVKGEAFGSDNGFGKVGSARFIAAVADDKILDHAAFELFASRVVLKICRYSVLDRNRVVLYPNVQGTGHLLCLLADLLRFELRIRE